MPRLIVIAKALSATAAGPVAIRELGRQLQAAEKGILASRIPWTFLRPTFLVDNFINYDGVDPKADSTVYLNGSGKAAWTDPGDMGECAAKVLAAAGYEERMFELIRSRDAVHRRGTRDHGRGGGRK